MMPDISEVPLEDEVLPGDEVLVGDDRISEGDRQRRWRLLLGKSGSSPTDGGILGTIILGKDDVRRDEALDMLYEDKKNVGRGPSSPVVSRWLGDIRTYFPASVVKVMQTDAMERLGLRQLLLEKEMLENVEPDISMVTTIISLNQLIPEESRETARAVVRKLVKELEERLASPLRQAVTGALNRSSKTNHPRRLSEVDWSTTIRKNLKHYQVQYKTIIPEQLVGYGRKSQQVQREIVLCLDQSGSMMSSTVYSSVLAAALAGIKALKTHLVAYDTTVIDLTDLLADPVDVLFGVQLGGGNDTPAALSYCSTLIRNPSNTILVLISDLFEGELSAQMIRLVANFVQSGVQVICLLALSDQGAPSFDVENAESFAALGVPSFACTPDKFPDLMAAAIERRPIADWAAANDIVTAVPVR
jgi:VWA domain containing CoxE-like protein